MLISNRISMKFSDIVLASTLAATPLAAQAEQNCPPGSPGYQEIPAATWLPTLARTCTIALTKNVALQTHAAFGKATIAGKDTGPLRKAEIQPVITHVHSEARSALEKVIQENGSGIVDE